MPKVDELRVILKRRLSSKLARFSTGQVKLAGLQDKPGQETLAAEGPGSRPVCLPINNHPPTILNNIRIPVGQIPVLR